MSLTYSIQRVENKLLNPQKQNALFAFMAGDKDLNPDEVMVGIPTKYFPIGYLAMFFYDFFAFGWLITKVWYKTPLNVRRGLVIALIGNVVFNVIMFNSPYWGPL